MDDKKPHKSSQKKIKAADTSASKPTPTPTLNSSSLPEILSKEENAIFLQEISKYLRQKESSSKEKVEDFKILHNNISEYLESFIIFGYTFEGKRVLIQDWPSNRDRDALLEFLKNVFIMNTSPTSSETLDNE